MINGRNLFNLILLLVMLIMVILSFEFNPKAQLFPLYVGLLTFLMLVWQFLYDKFPNLINKFKPSSSNPDPKEANEGEEQVSELTNDADSHEKVEEKPWLVALQCLIAMLVFTLLLALIPYFIAVPIFLLLFIWKIGKAKFARALSIAVVMSGFMYVLFDLILNARI